MSLRSMVKGSKGRPATKPSKKNSIGSMTAEMQTISRGMNKIANKTKAAPKTKKFTPKQIGQELHRSRAHRKF